MLTRTQKEEQVADLKDKFGRASCVYVAGYRGLDVESANVLRRRLHTEGGGDYEYRVIKNSVLRLAAGDTPIADVIEHFEGPTAIAISYGDPVGLAKVLSDFAKDNEVFDLRAGVLEGNAVDAAEIATVAKLPSLDQLRGMIIGLIQAPATKLVRLLSEPGGQLARVVSARGRQEGDA
ncbi:MAG: 50S ribosomal protein L10 [Deltaproteobacteria bacterium]|nr:50S ribosomal protein L10 [Deltaproteobacteria bacterium]MBW2400968.1 50S ribosomal protein L10 [Deltaproteobacteria bacterium]